ncbi:hypothetical protein [Alishewanella jeotgali]|uniref:Uncharacterized protein n=1 Tax=Alishewanella jeotgali KCTC 22429 TaxID=1129374 RepID=H3ZIH3_9ALTE|nr:hypothetical protein [Alishewanella jeotgali]EHR39623.1 hypothetical protein AJE_15919 [Alishewanella jeotgali KCTC 22429]
MKEQLLQLLLQAFDERIKAEKDIKAECEYDSAHWHHAFGRVDGVGAGRFIVEKVFQEHAELIESAHKRNTALIVELNELCQQHGIGKIGDSVVQALKHYIEQSNEFYQATELLLISEIGDFFAAHGGMLTVQQAQQELITRVKRVCTHVKLQAQHKPPEQICEGITDGFGTRDTCKKCVKFKPELAKAITNPVNPDICRWRIAGKCFVQFKAKAGAK